MLIALQKKSDYLSFSSKATKKHERQKHKSVPCTFLQKMITFTLDYNEFLRRT